MLVCLSPLIFMSFYFPKPTCSCKALQAAIGCLCLLSVAVSRLPQNFVAWKNPFILLTIRRVRSSSALVARLGGVSLIMRPRLVQLGWRVHLHAGFYSCGMAALPRHHGISLSRAFLWLGLFTVWWSQGGRTFYMTDDFQLARSRSC